MKTYRFLAQYVCVAQQFLPRRVVILSQQAMVLSLLAFDEMLVEPDNTLFCNGLISGELYENAPDYSLNDDVKGYIKTYTKPIVVGEKNTLLWWQNIDFTQWKFMENTSVNALI